MSTGTACFWLLYLTIGYLFLQVGLALNKERADEWKCFSTNRKLVIGATAMLTSVPLILFLYMKLGWNAISRKSNTPA